MKGRTFKVNKTFRLTDNKLHVYGITDCNMERFHCYSWHKGADGATVFHCSEAYTLFGILRELDVVKPDWKSIETEVMGLLSEKIRQSKLGNKNMLGKKLSERTKRKMSLANKGIHENCLQARMRKVICVETQVIFESQLAAQKVTGVNRKQISNVCAGRQLTAGGFHWKIFKGNNDVSSS